MKSLFFLFFILGVSTLVNGSSLCTKYELESDEKFEIKTLGSDNYLSIYSKSFDMNFFLKCPNNTNIYTKTLASNLKNKDNFLKIEVDSEISNIKISNYKNKGYVKEIKFSINSKNISSLTKKNTIYLNESNNQDSLYEISENNKNKSTLALSFQCSQEYFFNKFKMQALSFKNEKLNTGHIRESISKWKIQNNDNNNEKLISWFIDCQKWVNLTKNNSLEELSSVDKQIALQASKAHKRSTLLLRDLQQNAIYNRELDKNILQNFIEAMNALKILEESKSKYNIFNNVNSVFYIKNDKDLENKLNYILSHTQNSYYYNLLSNTNMGSFNDSSSFNLEFIPIKLSAFTLDRNKAFIVVKVESKLNLMSKDTQFTIYKLSNSFCSSLNTKINSINKKISDKIELIGYCYEKKFGSTYSPPRVASNKKYFKEEAQKPPSLPTEEVASSSKEGTCEDVENGVLCQNIRKDNLNSHIKSNLKIPSLEEMIDNFDVEDYEGSTVYAPNGKYFFFDEDSGWIDRDESDSDIIDLILIRN